VIIDRTTSALRAAKVRTVDGFRRGRRPCSAQAAPTGLPTQSYAWLKQPILETGLTRVGAVTTFATGPAFWFVADDAQAASAAAADRNSSKKDNEE